MIDDKDLLPGESVIWEGQPVRQWWVAREDWPLMLALPAFAVAGGLVVGFLWNTSNGSPPGPVKAFVWFWVAAVAVYGLSYPLRRQLRLERTRYALTTQRIFVEEGLLRSLRIYQFSQLGGPQLRRGAEGIGSIAMGGFPNPLAEYTTQRFTHLSGPQGWPRPVFWMIPDAENVHSLIEARWRESVAQRRRQAPDTV